MGNHRFQRVDLAVMHEGRTGGYLAQPGRLEGMLVCGLVALVLSAVAMLSVPLAVNLATGLSCCVNPASQ